jgi:hypothetical protein
VSSFRAGPQEQIMDTQGTSESQSRTGEPPLRGMTVSLDSEDRELIRRLIAAIERLADSRRPFGDPPPTPPPPPGPFTAEEASVLKNLAGIALNAQDYTTFQVISHNFAAIPPGANGSAFTMSSIQGCYWANP